MTFTLYRIPQLRANKQNSILFDTRPNKGAFFEQVSQKLTVSTNDSTVGRITDPGKLYQQVTVYTNGDTPYASFNYASITFSSGRQYFYFVTDFKEIGQSQVIYYLKKDTIITYVDSSGTSGVNLSGHKALVTREHKPRFKFDISRALYHDVPEPSDNTTPKVVNNVVFSGARGVRFVYKNRTDSKPVAYPYVENALSVSVQGAEWIGTIYSSSAVNQNEPMYAFDGDFEYTFGDGVPNTFRAMPAGHYVAYVRFGIGTRALQLRNKATGALVTNSWLGVPAGVDLKIKIQTRNIQELRYLQTYADTGTTWADIQTGSEILNYSPTSTKALPLWTEIDQYDAMTDRIIELPFFHASGYTFREDGYGIFINLESELELTTTALPIRRRPTGDFDMTRVDKNRVPYNDPKLYTSQFAPIIYNFNGASIGIKREQLSKVNGLALETPNPITVRIPTLTPSTFSMNISPSGTYEYEDIDELRTTWDVNNEIASIKDDAYTYNQYYKDLDDKQRRVQESAAVRNTALNAVNQALGVTGGMIAGGTPNPVQLGTRAGQAGINIAQSFMDLQDQLKLNEIAAKQKYIGLLLSSTQISGASLDFLKSFYGDKIRMINFGLTGRELDYWDEVFHKFGYTTLEYKTPTLKTRKYWDYKEMLIDEVSSAYVTDECIDDIKARFAEGVTLFHYQEDSSINWTQTKENWEI